VSFSALIGQMTQSVVIGLLLTTMASVLLYQSTQTANLHTATKVITEKA